MLNQIEEAINNKTISEYKIIEDRYFTLVRWLKLKCKDSGYISQEETLTLIKALEDDPIEETMEVEPNECK